MANFLKKLPILFTEGPDEGFLRGLQFEFDGRASGFHDFGPMVGFSFIERTPKPVRIPTDHDDETLLLHNVYVAVISRAYG